MTSRSESKIPSEASKDLDALWRTYHFDILLLRPLSHVRGSLAGRSLDVGSGNGQSLSLIEGFGVHSVGIDVNPSGGTAVRGTALKLPFKDRSFGLVVCLRTLQHIRDDRSALKEINRVLVPGGHIVAAVANRRSYSLVSLKSKGEWAGRDRIPYDWFRPYTKEELIELMKSEGFEVVESKVVGYAPELLRRHFPALSRFIVKAIKGGERALESFPVIGPRGTHVVVVARLALPTSSSNRRP